MKKTVDFDAIVIGAGFSGLYMLHKLRNDGFSVRVFEAGDDVGGTWYWNRYPGARCDIESIFYCYSFSEKITNNWTWSARFAEQPEILSYINYVADELDLRKDIVFNTRVKSAHYDEQKNLWRITLDDESIVTSHYFITGVGQLSSSNVPKMKGLENFKGDWYHTATWPKHEVSLEGKKVGVIGTGSTGVQVIPTIAPKVKELYVFQRTPQFSTPAQNRPLDSKYVSEIKANAHELKMLRTQTPMGIDLMPGERSALEVTEEERMKDFEYTWQKGAHAFVNTYYDIILNPEANQLASDFIRSKIHETVKDPETAQELTPDFYYGARRPILDTNYFETYNRENVKLVNVKKDPIQQITENGIQTSNQHYDLDMIIFATGYDAITGPLFKIDIRGKGGVALKDKWENGANVRTYLGLSTAGFPNMFMIVGPESATLGNFIAAIEQNVEWISDFINYARTQGIDIIEANEKDEIQYSSTCKEIADQTLFTKVDSWFTGSNVEGKPKPKGFLIYLAGFHEFFKVSNEIAANGYQGFKLEKSADFVG